MGSICIWLFFIDLLLFAVFAALFLTGLIALSLNRLLTPRIIHFPLLPKDKSGYTRTQGNYKVGYSSNFHKPYKCSRSFNMRAIIVLAIKDGVRKARTYYSERNQDDERHDKYGQRNNKGSFHSIFIGIIQRFIRRRQPNANKTKTSIRFSIEADDEK